MKKLNLFLMIVLILMAAFVVYFFVGGTLKANVSVITAPAADHPDAFQSIQGVLDAHAAPQQFAELSPDASLYTLVDMTITLANHGVFDAEWMDLTVEGANGDVAVYSLTGTGSDIVARSTGQLNLKLITSASADTARNFTLKYYVHGMLRTLNFTT